MPSPAASSDPGELIARYLDANPLPDDAQDGMTTEELAERLGLPTTPEQEAPHAQPHD